MVRTIIHRLGRVYTNRVCQSEFEAQRFTSHNERAIEYRFALQFLNQNLPQSVLDVGTGTTAWPHLLRNCGFVVTAIDNVRDYWPTGMVNRHWQVLDLDIVKPNGHGKQYDAVTCISVLEHIPNHAQAVNNMASMLNPGGILILTTPFSWSNPDPNVYQRSDALYGNDLPYICRSSSARELKEWLSFGLRLEQQELWKMFTGPVWATGELCARERVQENESHQLGCFCFRKADS